MLIINSIFNFDVSHMNIKQRKGSRTHLPYYAQTHLRMRRHIILNAFLLHIGLFEADYIWMFFCVGCRTWGILCLTFAFFWQLYTLWILTQLHESVPGTRYCRYLQLAKATFGEC